MDEGEPCATDQDYITNLISLLLIVAIAFTLAHCEKAPVPAAQEVVGEAKEERWK